jgi:hypothetical protein
MKKFTRNDITNCWEYALDYLVDILNDEYDLKEARNDLRSLIGSKHDKRIANKSIHLTDRLEKQPIVK